MPRHMHAASAALGRALLQTPALLPTADTAGPDCAREAEGECFNPSVAKRWAIGALFLILFSSALGEPVSQHCSSEFATPAPKLA
jgi:hypothetical protein